MSKKNMDILRDKLDQANANLLQSLAIRADIIQKIMEEKSRKELNAWDPKRERELFQALIQKKMTFTQLKILAFTMEEHASSLNEDYPRWSQKVHLREGRSNQWESMNPVLLQLIKSDEYEKLALTEKYKQLLEA